MHALNPESRVLLTGATGLIGGEVLHALLGYGVQELWTLVRPKNGMTPAQRMAIRMRRSGTDPDTAMSRVRTVAGDIRHAGMGLSPADAERIRWAADLVIHCGAETSFIREAECRDTNIVGMRNLIDFVRCCERVPLVLYVSTAANSGVVTNTCLHEDEGCNSESAHHNEYTRSKAVAEEMLRASGVPMLVVRPSIVLSRGLQDRRFARSILWFVPVLQEFEAIPVEPTSRLDIVPVDVVARWIVELLALRERQWDCYHLSEGTKGFAMCGSLSAYLDAHFSRTRPLRLVPPEQWNGVLHRHYVRSLRQRKLWAGFRHYLPFLNMNVVYDNTRLRDELGEVATRFPSVTEYMGDLLHLIGADEAEAECEDP